MPPTPARSKFKRAPLAQDAARLFLDQYFPFHYEVGFAVERELRDPRLTQHQSVILWVVHAVGDKGVAIDRKDIERYLSAWFDVGSSAVSKAVRGLAKEPLQLVSLQEHPQSGRKKVVSLTPAGKRVVQGMIKRGETMIQKIVDELSDDEVAQGLNFLQRVSTIVKSF